MPPALWYINSAVVHAATASIARDGRAARRVMGTLVDPPRCCERPEP
jgi:hypothetical protein